MTAKASAREQRVKEGIEFGATVLMAVAAILTAWAAFQSTKWSGVQADNYSAASAARTESAKATTLAATQRSIDAETFLSWLSAYSADLKSGAVDPAGAYDPDAATLSGFIADRFRPEFLPAFDAWIASRPVVNDEAAGTPLELPEYQLEASAIADQFEADASAKTATARDANQRGDNYVLLTVLFATALFFAGISGKLDSIWSTSLAFGVGALIVIVAVSIMATFPVSL